MDAIDYFYDVRKRMERFQQAWIGRDLSAAAAASPLRMIDCILEAQNLAVHILGKLMQDPVLYPRGIPPYAYSSPDFLA